MIRVSLCACLRVSVSLSVCLSVCLPVYLSVCRSVGLSVFVSLSARVCDLPQGVVSITSDEADVWVPCAFCSLLFCQGDDQGKMRVKVHQVSRNSQAVYAGVVSNKTHVICRSRSSRIFWLVQVRVPSFHFFSIALMLRDFSACLSSFFLCCVLRHVHTCLS